jgi:hypothetical protein
MERYGVGIIGAGWVAGEYVKIFGNHPRAELVGVYNRTPGKAMALLESLGVEAREYASLDELFDDERIQIIASCTHPDTRREHCVRAAETGRHIVIEKPVGVTLDDSLAIRDAVARAGVKNFHFLRDGSGLGLSHSRSELESTGRLTIEEVAAVTVSWVMANANPGCENGFLDRKRLALPG